MRNMRFVAFFVVFFIFSGFATAQDLMPLDDVERLIDSSPNKEVKAYFHSVERGTEIKRYDIVLRGVLREPGFNVIMFVTSEKIVAGMSGSPVYINGKLIGAMAYGFNSLALSDWWWGGISPIHSMIEQAEAGRLKRASPQTSNSLPVNFDYKGMAFKPISTGHQVISGFEFLGEVILSKTSSQTFSAGSNRPVLKAGMPIVVDLVEWTDEKGESSTLSAMGTITYIDSSGRIYAFGHSFLESRSVVYSFRTAEIMGTVYSELNSYKLTGKTSEVLGSISYDASYGISGSVSLDELNKLNHFSLEFKNEGRFLHKFDIKVADSILTPLLTQVSFQYIGEIYGAPLPQETSVTQIESKIELEGHETVFWNELFASSSVRFGVRTIYLSSYEVAYESFFNRIYGQLFENNYNLKISNVSISVNFIPGRSRTFELGAYKFPNKVTYGQDPVLEIMFVDKENSISIAKKIPIKIDWDKVENPVYTKETLDTDKVAEKVVYGSLGIYSSQIFFRVINQSNGSEKQRFNPVYFLSSNDFLENFSRLLEATNQKVFLRVTIKSKSGLFDDQATKAKDLMPQGIPDNGSSGWHIIEGGLKNRVETVKDEGYVVFYPELPLIPEGYVLNQNVYDSLIFEIVNEK